MTKDKKNKPISIDVMNKNQDLLQTVRDCLEKEDRKRLKLFLSNLHPSEIADLIESMPSAIRLEFWNGLDTSVRGNVLAEASAGVRSTLLKQIDAERVVTETSNLDTDELADIIQELPDDFADEVLLSMNEQNRQRVAAALTYPQDTAGGLMNVEVATIRQDVEVDVVLRFLRRYGPISENLNQLFVIDRNNHLLGSVSLTNLVIADPDVSVNALMTDVKRPISANLSATEVTVLFERFDLISAPVVDESNRLIGFITVDDVVDVLREETDRKIMSSAGIVEDYDMFAPILVTSKQRALWLAINLGTAFLAAWVIGLFEATIEKMVALAVLMPIVASMGGIAGTQTLTIVVRGLSLGQVGAANSWSVLTREVTVGLLNGCLWAFVVALVAATWFGDFWLGVIIALAMIVNLVTAGFSGAAIPLLLQRLNVDPALAGGVVLTTITDMVGFFAFLGLASKFLV